MLRLPLREHGGGDAAHHRKLDRAGLALDDDVQHRLKARHQLNLDRVDANALDRLIEVDAAAINFPACTGGSNTITYFSVVKETSGASVILYSGALTASLAVSSGITPSFAIGELDITED